MEKDPRTGGTGGGRENLRDWQKEDTWYGSFPVPENPFDEPEDAPELRDLRSEELNNRSGQFWESQTNGYRFGQERSDGPEGSSGSEKKDPEGPRVSAWPAGNRRPGADPELHAVHRPDHPGGRNLQRPRGGGDPAERPSAGNADPVPEYRPHRAGH